MLYQDVAEFEAAFSDDENVSESTGSRSSSFTQDHELSSNEIPSKERTYSQQSTDTDQGFVSHSDQGTVGQEDTAPASNDTPQEDLAPLKRSCDTPSDQAYSYFYQG